MQQIPLLSKTTAFLKTFSFSYSYYFIICINLYIVYDIYIIGIYIPYVGRFIKKAHFPRVFSLYLNSNKTLKWVKNDK